MLVVVYDMFTWWCMICVRGVTDICARGGV